MGVDTVLLTPISKILHAHEDVTTIPMSFSRAGRYLYRATHAGSLQINQKIIFLSDFAHQARDTQDLLHNKQEILRSYCTTSKGYSGPTAQQARHIQDLLHNKQGILRTYCTTSKAYSRPTAQQANDTQDLLHNQKGI